MAGVPFYDLSEEERANMTLAAIANGTTVMERWRELGSREANPWTVRAKIAAGLLTGHACVVDLGCGTMNLERHLAEGQAYVPVDVVARDERTIVCDFNLQPLPSIPAMAAACLGLVEYLHRPDDFLKDLRLHYKEAVISYNVTDASRTMANRRAQAWVNDFDTAEFEAMLLVTGWTIAETKNVGESQKIWLLR